MQFHKNPSSASIIMYHHYYYYYYAIEILSSIYWCRGIVLGFSYTNVCLIFIDHRNNCYFLKINISDGEGLQPSEISPLATPLIHITWQLALFLLSEKFASQIRKKLLTHLYTIIYSFLHVERERQPTWSDIVLIEYCTYSFAYSISSILIYFTKNMSYLHSCSFSYFFLFCPFLWISL